MLEKLIKRIILYIGIDKSILMEITYFLRKNYKDKRGLIFQFLKICVWGNRNGFCLSELLRKLYFPTYEI